MDNNIEILFFILFVAFSILSSILDKKKKQKRKEQTKNIPKSGQVKTKPEAKSEKSPEELIREMFGLPTTEDQTKPQHDSYSEGSKEYYEESKSWNPEQEFKSYDEQFNKPEIKVNSREEAKSKYSNFIGKDFKTPTAEDEIHKLTEDLFSVKAKAKKYSRSKLINQIKDPNSLKDYIVVSEILQKPISLR